MVQINHKARTVARSLLEAAFQSSTLKASSQGYTRNKAQTVQMAQDRTSKCGSVEENPSSFVYIPPMKQIKQTQPEPLNQFFCPPARSTPHFEPQRPDLSHIVNTVVASLASLAIFVFCQYCQHMCSLPTRTARCALHALQLRVKDRH